jgi:hypothetical protein
MDAGGDGRLARRARGRREGGAGAPRQRGGGREGQRADQEPAPVHSQSLRSAAQASTYPPGAATGSPRRIGPAAPAQAPSASVVAMRKDALRGMSATLLRFRD